MPSTTKVVHCKRELFDVYCGRPSLLGNPFTHIKDKKTKAEFLVNTREEAVSKHKEYISEHSELLPMIYDLKGKTISCWCAPKLCHCCNYLDIIEEKFGGERKNLFTLIHNDS